mgnify:CR=1 FL=1
MDGIIGIWDFFAATWPYLILVGILLFVALKYLR